MGISRLNRKPSHLILPQRFVFYYILKIFSHKHAILLFFQTIFINFQISKHIFSNQIKEVAALFYSLIQCKINLYTFIIIQSQRSVVSLQNLETVVATKTREIAQYHPALANTMRQEKRTPGNKFEFKEKHFHNTSDGFPTIYSPNIHL